MENIRNFDIQKISSQKAPSTILIMGEKGSGKSTLAYDIIQNCRISMPIWGICGNNVTPKWINNFYEMQKDLGYLDMGYLDMYESKPLPEKGWISLLFDDCDSSFFNRPEIERLFLNAHELHIQIIVTTCAINLPHWINCFDYTFFLRNNKINDRNFFEYYNSLFIFTKNPLESRNEGRDYKYFKTIYTRCTMDYGCLVIHYGNLSFYRSDPNLIQSDIHIYPSLNMNFDLSVYFFSFKDIDSEHGSKPSIFQEKERESIFRKINEYLRKKEREKERERAKSNVQFKIVKKENIIFENDDIYIVTKNKVKSNQ